MISSPDWLKSSIRPNCACFSSSIPVFRLSARWPSAWRYSEVERSPTCHCFSSKSALRCTRPWESSVHRRVGCRIASRKRERLPGHIVVSGRAPETALRPPEPVDSQPGFQRCSYYGRSEGSRTSGQPGSHCHHALRSARPWRCRRSATDHLGFAQHLPPRAGSSN